MVYFHFVRPWWLFALLPMGLFLWQWYRYRQKNSAWQKICEPIFIERFLKKSQRFDVVYWFIGFLSLITILALVGPAWSEREQPVFQTPHARVILFDLSSAMLANDVLPDRATRASYKIADILQQYPEGMTALIAYSREAFVVTPLTDDIAMIKTLLPELNPRMMPVLGSNLTNALVQAKKLLTNANVKGGDIIVLTASDITAEDKKMAAQLALSKIFTSVLSIGTPDGAPIPTAEGPLRDEKGQVQLAKVSTVMHQQLAKAGGGFYAAFTDNDDDLRNLAPALKRKISAQITTQTTKAWEDKGWILCIALMLLMLLLFWRGFFEEVIA